MTTQSDLEYMLLRGYGKEAVLNCYDEVQWIDRRSVNGINGLAPLTLDQHRAALAKVAA
jgi:hypothetical protein